MPKSRRLFTFLFEGNLAAVAQQLCAIEPDHSSTDLTPAHMALFQTILQPDEHFQQTLEHMYEQFHIESDTFAAAACIGSAIAGICDTGTDLNQLAPWYARIPALLKKKELPPLTEAYLLLQQAWVEIYTADSLAPVSHTFKLQRQAAERAASASLQILNCALSAYSLSYLGEIARAELLLKDAAPLLAAEDVSPAAAAHHQISCGMISFLLGRPREGIAALTALLDSPAFHGAPATMEALALNHLLHAYILDGDFSGIETIAERIRNLAIPAGNNFHRSYLHCSLAAAALVKGQPQKALYHSEEAISRANRSNAGMAIRINAQLYGLCLADLGRDQEALDHFESWIERWETAGYCLIAEQGLLETAMLYFRQGNIERARTAWDQAHQMLPPKEPILHLYRPADWYRDLQQRLFPTHSETALIDVSAEDAIPVQIQTMGSFRMIVNGRELFDRDWRGRNAKRLLFALIANGGYKVSRDCLAGILWPDADGDLAANSLNVTLSRLRRVGDNCSACSLQWVVLKHTTVSLVAGLCRVDALAFREELRQALKTPSEPTGLEQALQRYTGPFLPTRDCFGCIEAFRTELQHLYLSGVRSLAKCYQAHENRGQAMNLLEQATDFLPLAEELYEQLMQLCLLDGKPVRAMEFYHLAAKRFADELGMKPGSRLTALAHKARALS